MSSETWHRCHDCDVTWKGPEARCFVCGEISDEAKGPRLTSGPLVGPMTDTEWAWVRRQIGAD